MVRVLREGGGRDRAGAAHERLAGNASMRRALYAGDVLLRSPVPASRRLASAALEALRHGLADGGDPRDAASTLSPAEYFLRVGRVRRSLFEDPALRETTRELIAVLGFDPERTAYDPLRLRAISHRGHENPDAHSVYVAHRDTWYSHSQALINCWIPLHDVREEETFVFHRHGMELAVENDSASFEYQSWVAPDPGVRIGWQDPKAGQAVHYPGTTLDIVAEDAVGFSAACAEMVLFSGAHLHQTRRHATGRTRFSVDFRIVSLDDHESGAGAPNVDNRSRGSALVDYLHCAGAGERDAGTDANRPSTERRQGRQRRDARGHGSRGEPGEGAA